ncbi:MAG: hypothetical protein MI723_19810, partial [Caulobacterales bacterium]|nr:hypothetical protein [Caulobacterales bacterium]
GADWSRDTIGAISPDGPLFGVSRRAFTTRLGGQRTFAEAESARALFAGGVLPGLFAGVGTGVEEIAYDGEDGRADGRVAGLTRAAYLTAFAEGRALGWRLGATADMGRISFDFDAYGDASARLRTDGSRLRAEAFAGRDLRLLGAPFVFDLGARYADLVADDYRREDGLWIAGPEARFATASAGLTLQADPAHAGFVPYMRVSGPVWGEAEAWRAAGVRFAGGDHGVAIDLAVRETRELDDVVDRQGEVRLNLRF